MATSASPNVEKRSRIPVVQYFLFRRAKSAAEVEALNAKVTEKGLKEEARMAGRLLKEGILTRGNGLDAFVSACERRMGSPEWHRVREHSERVRRFSYCITETLQKDRRREGKRVERTELEVVGKLAGFHDIGKTLIAPYLINREDGTWFDIGRGMRIDFGKELAVLRLSHVEAGMRFLGLYRQFMSEAEYGYAKQVIGWHHIAFDGIGTASAPSYPERIGGTVMKDYIEECGIPEVARIIRAADVYSAIMENRFYLSESEKVVPNVTGIRAADAALGMLIAVAGTDVDPGMVEHLIVGKYGVQPEMARDVVSNLACRKADWLKEKGGDIRFSLEWVIPKDSFRDVIFNQGRRSEWDEPLSSARMWQRIAALCNG